MKDYTVTHCPYCEQPYNGKYEWRFVSISEDSKSTQSMRSINAIEIFCSQCRSTISITPLPER